MATFRIHEDYGLSCEENVVKENKSKIPKRIEAGAKRIALQSFNNGVRQEKKRFKMENKENVEPTKEQNLEKNEPKPKINIDTDLLQIVSNDCKNKKSKKDASKFPFPDEYAECILKHYKDMECFSLSKENYMDKQPHVTWSMRSVLVDWLVSVTDEYDMSADALYLAVNYIDRFLSKICVVREKLQLVGASAMLIAGKLEDVYPPTAKECAYLTCDTYSIRQILKMEQFIVKILDFRLQPPTSYTFLRQFCTDNELDETTMNLALYLTELALLEGNRYLNFKPSEIAAASILHARYNLKKSTIWPTEMEKSSGYTIKHLSPIVQAQSVTLKDSPHKPQQAVQEKYKSMKYGRVALMKPRNLLREVLEGENTLGVEE